MTSIIAVVQVAAVLTIGILIWIYLVAAMRRFARRDRYFVLRRRAALASDSRNGRAI